MSFDAHIRSLHQDVAHAETLVAASERALIDLLKIMLDQGPDVAAGRYLERRLTGRVASELRRAGLGREAARDLARSLIRDGRSRPAFLRRVEAEL